MNGVNNSKIPWIDLEKLGLVTFDNFDEFTRDVMFSSARSHQHFHTSKLSSRDFLLDKTHNDLISVLRQILTDTSHPDHLLVKGMTHEQACEYVKLRHPVAYIGRSLNIRTTSLTNFLGKSKWENCIDGAAASEFSWMIDTIKSWPLFADIGRIVLFQTEHHSTTPAHRDWKVQDEFVWIGFGQKKFFVFDEQTDTKHLVAARAAYFNNSDFHGTDPVDVATISLRVDGVFTEAARRTIREAVKSSS